MKQKLSKLTFAKLSTFLFYFLLSYQINAQVTITTQPVDEVVCVGETATFSVVAGGTTSGLYQWYKNGILIPGATGDSYTTPITTFSNNLDEYDVEVMCLCGTSLFSDVAELTVDEPVNITSGPFLNHNLCEGGSKTLTITASGTISGYQWKKNGSPISGATNPSYSISNATSADAGSYTVEVTGPCNIDDYGPIAVSVNLKPVVTTSPSSAIKCETETVTFTAAATNAGSVIWQKDGVDLSNGGTISGATTTSLTISNLCFTCDPGNYTAKFFGAGACASQSVITNPANLVVDEAVEITSGPFLSYNLCEGGSQTLTITASGTISGYQWKKNGSPISGATNPSYSISNATSADAGSYTVEVTGPCNTDDYGPIAVSVNLKPVVTTSPSSAIKCATETITFTAAATNAGSVIWQKDGVDLVNGGTISGATTTTLTISNLCFTCDPGNYTAKFFGAGACASQSVITNPANLVVDEAAVIRSAPELKQEICEGETKSFSVLTAGTITGYQWRKNGNPIIGATTNVLTISNATTADVGSYTLSVFGPCNTATYGPLTLNVNFIPFVTASPLAAIKCATETVTFTAVATNPGRVIWQKDGVDLANGGNISGATSATLTISNLCFTCDPGNYTAKFFGAGGCGNQSVITNTAKLTVDEPVSILSGSTLTHEICEGGFKTFSIVAAGTITGYQWKKDGSPIAGATTNILNITNATAADLGVYTIDVSGPCNTATYGPITLNVNLKPAITKQPIDAIRCVGESVTFSIEGSNLGSFNWFKNGVSLGVSTQDLTITSVDELSGGQYSVQTGGIGACAVESVTSGIAQLTINVPVVITSAPALTNEICEGENKTFTVTATGTITGYQWKKDGSPIAGATTNILNITNATSSDLGVYTIDVSGPCNTATYGPITLNVNLKPAITQQPIDAKKCVGESVTFSIEGSNLGSFNWFKNGVSLGVSTQNLTITSVDELSGGQYSVQTGGIGACAVESVTSGIAQLTINVPVVITSAPALTNEICEGENKTFTVTATGTITGYQWKKDGSSIAGATTNILNITNATAADLGVYTIDVSGPCNTATYGPITLNVNLKPAITQQPIDAKKCVGESVTFSIEGSNLGSFNWFKNGVSLGVTTQNLTITSVDELSGGQYSVQTSGVGACAAENVTSSVAQLTINDPVAIASTPALTNEICEGENKTFTVTATGTITGYQWKKDGNSISGATSNVLTITNATTADLGVYSVDVIGACNTVTYSSITLNVNLKPVITKQPIDAKKCVGESVTFSIEGSNLGSFNWIKNGVSLGITTQNLTITNVDELASGQYSVQTKGTGACAAESTSSQIANLEVGKKILVEKIIKNPSCFGLSDGSTQLNLTGGFGSSYTVSWQGSTTFAGSTATALSAGLYEFTVADSLGCIQKDSVRITQPDKLTVNLLSKTQNYCETSGKATLKVTALGGTEPYKASWSDSPNFVELDRQNLKAGNYALKVIDSKNCEASLNAVVEDSTAKMTAKLTYSQPSCFGKADAKLIATVAGGRNGYKYTWSGITYDGSDSEIAALAVNNENAQVTVIDNFGCEVKSDPIKLISPAALPLNIVKNKEVCPSKAFEINGTVADGVKYEWTSPLNKKYSGAIITGDSVGVYKIVVTNTLGCIAVDNVTIVPNSVVKPFTAAPSEAPINKEVIFVDLTNPIVTSVKWLYPSTSKLIAEEPIRLKLSFPAAGTYTITSKITVADCIYTYNKNISIVEQIEDGEFAPPTVGYQNFDFLILPNPVTDGIIKLKLSENHPKNFTISLISISGTQVVFSKKFENVNEDLLLIDVPANLIQSSNYILTLENEVSRSAKRVLILN